MPLLVEHRLGRRRDEPIGVERRQAESRWLPVLDIGLVNNMPDAALRPTEQQFIALLSAAAGDRTVRLHLLSLPSVARGTAALAHIRSAYADMATLKTGRLDALIVTGAEPIAPTLPDEPYWSDLTELADWAESHTVSTVWSCLAAHAAVLHFDGIARHRLDRKCFGLFACDKTLDDPLVTGIDGTLSVPHSRWNGVEEDELKAHGYRIVTRSPDIGVDVFTKQWGSLFVFLQGHPEYAVDTLFREYRRDMTRYLRDERPTLPDLPIDYFDARTERALGRIAERAAGNRGPDAQARMPDDWTLRQAAVQAWQTGAVGLYRNWLDRVAALKAR